MQTNTYQGLIVTDTVSSYYAFSYTCGDIEWSGQGFEIAVVGYNSHGDYFDNHPANGFPDIGRIVSCTREIIPQGGQRKRRSAQGTGGSAGSMPCNVTKLAARMACMTLTMLTVNVSMIGVDVVGMLPRCPRIRVAAAGDPTVFIPFIQADCFRSVEVVRPISPTLQQRFDFVSVCCYDDSG